MIYGYQTWSEESLMQVYDDDDLHGGQRSSEVKVFISNLFHICGQKAKLQEILQFI